MTETSQPKVSILLAYYNNLNYVRASIESVYAQTYTNWELIVVNDCSPDPAAQTLIQSLQTEYGFTLINSEKNSGASKAFQTAFEHASGEYISLISHDDLYTPDKIEYSIHLILQDHLDALYCNGTLLTPDGKEKPFPVDEVLQKQQQGQESVAALISSKDSVTCLLTQGAVYKRKIFSDLAWVKDRFLLDDWPFTIMVWRNYKVRFDPKPIYIYRFHDDNIHRQFWKWFPSRVQVVSELVSEDQKLEVLSYLLTNMGEFSLKNSRNEDAFRFAAAGLALAQSKDNMAYAAKVISKSKVEKTALHQFNRKVKEAVSSRNSWNKLKRKLKNNVRKLFNRDGKASSSQRG